MTKCNHLNLKKVAPTLYAALVKTQDTIILRCDCGQMFTASPTEIQVSK